MVAFGNPVQGLIRPPGSPLIVGNMRVTCSFACHEARTPPKQGTDVGDATCGKPVLAMASGRISLLVPGKVGSTASADASILRIKRPDGYEVGVAHLKIKAGLAVGQQVAEGDVVGSLDKVGASSCHVHIGCKDPAGNEIDVWPLLRQNGATEGEMIPIPVAAYTRLANKKTSLTANGNFRAERLSSAPVLKQFPAGTVFYPVAMANDGSKPVGSTSTLWYYGILYDDSPAGYIGGWFHSSLIGPLVDDVSAGFTQKDLDDAKAAGRADGIQAAKDDLADLK